MASPTKLFFSEKICALEQRRFGSMTDPYGVFFAHCEYRIGRNLIARVVLRC